MGLHPRAILSVMLQIIELMHKGYKIILSTHSTLPLEFAWAFNMLKPENSKFGISPLLKLFGMEGCKSSDKGIFSNIWDKEIKTYLFSYKGEKVQFKPEKQNRPKEIDKKLQSVYPKCAFHRFFIRARDKNQIGGYSHQHIQNTPYYGENPSRW